jgi:phospholipase C
MRRRAIFALLSFAVLATLAGAVTHAANSAGKTDAATRLDTTTPIKHVVVIFQENVSFDHYFATYPVAANSPGEPAFTAAPGTPSVNGLSDSLLAPNNPNDAQPFRLDRSQFETNSQDHGYTSEQKAYDKGLMDNFVAGTGRGNSQVMGYYDGNTVTALWNYAQHFAMSDNSFSTGFGPSTVGAINLVSGNTHGFTTTSSEVSSTGTIFSDPQPTGDICDTRDNTTQAPARDKNVGDLLNAHGVTWGWFQGGFREAAGAATCNVTHANEAGVVSKDYIPHHEPFQYYRSTQNLQHLPPSSVDAIGTTDQANHQYDLSDFWAAVDNGNMPAVSFLKAAGYQDGHAGYSDPLDEQTFIVDTINRLERSKYWHDTAVVIAYDDSDGWYDHQMGPIVNQSQDPSHDALDGTQCGSKADTQRTLGGYQDRCGYGPRQPLLVISPYAKANYVDHTVTDQTSILRFVEDNWQTGRIGDFSLDTKAGTLLNMFDFSPSGSGQGGSGSNEGANKLFLDPSTGEQQ